MSELVKTGLKKERSSNLELLRIIAMLSIVAHHYVVNSGVTELYNINDGITSNALFMQLFGMWGKTAINAFIMISGYFMCTSKLTVKRFGKVYLEAKFYSVIIYIILLIIGYETISVGRVFLLIFGYLCNINDGFTPSFLAFYLFIPFYNALINALDRKKHLQLICFALIVYTVSSTFMFNSVVFNYIGWYIVIYFVAAYIRLYPSKWMNENKKCVPVLLGLVIMSYLSVIVVDFLGMRFGFDDAYYMVSDSNKIFAFLIGVFSFLTFKNLKIKNSKFINTVASTTFGVLCIHASSAAMRQMLWHDIVDTRGHYSLALPQLILYSFVVIIIVFTVCSVIDIIRIRFIEKPLFKWLDKYEWFYKTI